MTSSWTTPPLRPESLIPGPVQLAMRLERVDPATIPVDVQVAIRFDCLEIDRDPIRSIRHTDHSIAVNCIECGVGRGFALNRHDEAGRYWRAHRAWHEQRAADRVAMFRRMVAGR